MSSLTNNRYNAPVSVTDCKTPNVFVCPSCSTRWLARRQGFCNSCSRTSPCDTCVSSACEAIADPSSDTCVRSSSSTGTHDTIRVSNL